MSEQKGKYRHGVFGYPLHIITGIELWKTVPSDRPNVSVVTGLTLKITRPDATCINRTLDVNVAIIDEATGTVEYVFQSGDLTIAFEYRILLTIDSGPTKRMIFESVFEIT